MSGVSRAENWVARLAAYIQAHLEIPFAWGGNDCFLFAMGGVRAMTGTDMAADYRGYRCQFGAGRTMARHGFADLRDAVTKIAGAHGCPSVAPAFAQRGDLVLLETDLGLGCGLIGLSGAEIVLPDTDGLALLPRGLATDAWRI